MAGGTREQFRAWWAVRYALGKGTLIRPATCQRCGKRPGNNKRGRSMLEAHHHRGYSEENKLDVIFLCPSCHRIYPRLAAMYSTRPYIKALCDGLQAAKVQRELLGAPGLVFRKPWDA